MTDPDIPIAEADNDAPSIGATEQLRELLSRIGPDAAFAVSVNVRLLRALLAKQDDLASRVAELEASPTPSVPNACPKCGHADTSMAYCDGCRLRPWHASSYKHADDECRDGDLEHNHRYCRRCAYRWRTDDVIGARKVCPG